MALWGKTNVVGSGGSVSLNYSTGVVTGAIDGAGAGTSFGSVGAAKTGDIIRFGSRGPESSTGGTGTFFGDAVIVSIASTTSLTIGSTAGLSGAAIAVTSFYIAESPQFLIGDSSYSETNSDYDKIVYGVGSGTLSDESQVGSGQTTTENPSAAERVAAPYLGTTAGWVGVTTYVDTHGNLRVKNECLVAASGINTVGTGLSAGINFPTPASAAS
tara:strand:- start:862 stop:1506 length:645 start_codon:yes stop_codon:yes gene_type:complete